MPTLQYIAVVDGQARLDTITDSPRQTLRRALAHLTELAPRESLLTSPASRLVVWTDDAVTSGRVSVHSVACVDVTPGPAIDV